MPVGGDQEATCSRGGVLNHLAGFRLHQPHHAIDQWARRKILPSATFFLGGILFKEPFIKVAEPLLARGVPVELVDGARQRLEIRRLAQLGLRVRENRQDGLVACFLGVARSRRSCW
jgi:hypothetical protein